KGLNEDLFYGILKYLPYKDVTRFSLVCKTFRKFYNSTVNSYNYFSKIDTSKYNVKDFESLLTKAKNLKHIQRLQEIIRRDFGDKKGEGFLRRVVVRMKLTRVEDIEYKGALFEVFHILPKKSPEDNFLNTDSVHSICTSS